MIDPIKAFFESWSWLHTAVTSIAGLLALGIWVSKWIRSYKAKRASKHYRSIDDFVTRTVGSDASTTSRLLAQMRVIVVDDVPDDFPIPYFQKLFSVVDVQTSLSIAEANLLGSYDIIFLDIKGVVPEDLESGGLTLIKHTRATHAHAIIVGVSSKKFDPTVTEFFRIADIQLRKPLRGPECHEQLQLLFREKRGPHAMAARIDREIDSALSESTTPHLRQTVVAFLTSTAVPLSSLEPLRVELGNVSYAAVCADASLLREQLIRLRM